MYRAFLRLSASLALLADVWRAGSSRSLDEAGYWWASWRAGMCVV